MKTSLPLSKLQSQGLFVNSVLDRNSSVQRKQYLLSNMAIADDEERTFTACMSTPEVDRDGEVVVSAGVDVSEYAANSVLCWAHKYDVPPIGKCIAVQADSAGLLGKFQLADTAAGRDAWTLVKSGCLNTVSIGFARTLTFKRGQPGFDAACRAAGADPATTKQVTPKAVLLETSLVVIPAHRQALIGEIAAKGLKGLGDQMGCDVQDDQPDELDDMPADDPGIKPYPTEHAARQEDPNAFSRFRRVNGAGGPGVDFVYGIDKHGKTHLQTVRFDATKFTPAEADAWLKKNDLKTEVEPAVPHKTDEPVQEAMKTDEAPVATPGSAPAMDTEAPGAMVAGVPAGAACAQDVALKAEPAAQPVMEPVAPPAPQYTVLRQGPYQPTAQDSEAAKAWASGRVV